MTRPVTSSGRCERKGFWSVLQAYHNVAMLCVRTKERRDVVLALWRPPSHTCPKRDSFPSKHCSQNAGMAASSVTRARRPYNHPCRFVRLGTASLLSEPGGPFINSDKIDLRCD